ncbi:MAG: DNA helicase UvrD, partial [Armatimonadota bacterium]|nr:DNA helicase UvrD [Armatimonadota bacterium]
PEEGKYHVDGHRNCNRRMTPKETKAHNGRCPVCGKPPTVGVLHRVEDLADREEGFVPEGAVPYRNLVPLEEIIAEANGSKPGTVGVREEYFKLCKAFGGEFSVLLDAPVEDVYKLSTARIAEGLRRVREGRVSIAPGYDGVFGEISIFKDGEEIREPVLEEPAQTTLF